MSQIITVNPEGSEDRMSVRPLISPDSIGNSPLSKKRQLDLDSSKSRYRGENLDQALKKAFEGFQK